MKHSRYNVVIPTKGFTIIYNSFTDKFIGLSNESANSFNNLKEFQQNYKLSFDKLTLLGMIVNDDFDELSIIRANHKISVERSKDLYVMIYPTQDCNLKCWYCYESHVCGSLMSGSVMNAAISAIKKKLESKELNSLLIGFFGGEPLINFHGLAYPLSLRLKQLAEEKGVKFATFFVTNASLINEDMVRDFTNINPFFQITLDGTQEKHNSVRVWKNNNQGTYETIVNAIKLISKSIKNDFSDDPLITIRLNYDNQTLKNIDRLISDLKDVDRSQVVIHFERIWQTRHLVDDEQRELLFNAIKQFVKEGFTIKHGVFKRKHVSCPSDTHDFMIINYDGKLYKCNGRTLTTDSKEGELLNDGTIQWDEAKLRKRFSKITFENPKCLNCKMLPLCMGPCSQKLIEEGSYCNNICSLNSIDFSIEDFLKVEFEMRYILQNL